MKVRDYHRQHPLTLAQLRACLYLERHQQRFLIHFGWQNAVALAKQHRARRHKEKLP